jgi:hypothetical protein
MGIRLPRRQPGEQYFWWGNELSDGEGRLNISAVDFLPDRKQKWPLASAPWSDGFSFVSPVDHYGERGRNGFGLADMCGGVWEVILDHFDPKGGHEELHVAIGELPSGLPRRQLLRRSRQCPLRVRVRPGARRSPLLRLPRRFPHLPWTTARQARRFRHDLGRLAISGDRVGLKSRQQG